MNSTRTKNETALSAKPVLLFAYADDPPLESDRRQLRHLAGETRDIREKLKSTGVEEICDVEVRTNATIDDLVRVFEEYAERVAIFHFGGHANSYQLLMQSPEGRRLPADAQSVAEYLGTQGGLDLVFLNGCCTRSHVEALHAAGINYVIGTSMAIDDAIASYFAAHFYGRLGSGDKIRVAFDKAVAAAKLEWDNNPSSAHRSLGMEEADLLSDEAGWPWRLDVVEGASEWSLLSKIAGPQREPESPPSTGYVLFAESGGQRDWFYAPAPIVGVGYQSLARIVERTSGTRILEPGMALTRELLERYAAFVLPIGPEGKCRLLDTELAALQGYVEGGGGVLLLSTYTGDWHHEANLNAVSERFGIVFNNDVVLPAGSSQSDAREQLGDGTPESGHVVIAAPPEEQAPSALARRLLEGVNSVTTLSSCSLTVSDAASPILSSSSDSVTYRPRPMGAGIVIARYEESAQGSVPLVAASKSRRLVAVGSWKIFLNDFLESATHDNERLFENVLAWLTERP